MRPLPVDQVMGRERSYKEPILLGDQLFWAEQRPDQGGRTTLMRQSAPGALPQDLIPGPWTLRSRVHEFGGGLFCASEELAVFIEGRSGVPHVVTFSPGAQPSPLTNPEDESPGRYADGLIDAARQRWLGVRETETSDQLVALPLTGGQPQLLRQGADFCGYAALSPCGDQLAWLEWSLPWMPWERTELWWSRLGDSGELLSPRRIAGGDQNPQSLFQPLWSGDGQLLIASDCSGWWTPQRWCPGQHPAWQPLPLPQACETAMPQWVYGMRTMATSESALLALACHQGEWSLWHYPWQQGHWQPFALPMNELSGLTASGTRAVCLGASAQQRTTLLELDLVAGSHHALQSAAPWPQELVCCSEPRALHFQGGDGQTSHGWYYPPTSEDHGPAPLLVKAHSGPTGMARTGLNLAIQFWTSRGWGVVDVNYGGSTGFGRHYRQRLDGQWGVLDVADCAAAVALLVEQGAVDPQRVAMEGGSAGGFTTLAALINEPVFRAGVCRYPVCDLQALTNDTHRFESGYLDRLIGSWPEQRKRYEQRSPRHHSHELNRPVLFIQGLQDRVVPPEQVEEMVQTLRWRGLAAELMVFENEGHGFRSAAVQRQVLEATEQFLLRVLPQR
jgi:acetyl esterase/lipase